MQALMHALAGMFTGRSREAPDMLRAAKASVSGWRGSHYSCYHPQSPGSHN